MNNVYENNMRFVPLLKFIDKYKNVIILVAVLLVGSIAYFVIDNQIEKNKSEQASIVYKEWLQEISQENPNNDNLNKLLDRFLNDFKNTGYTQLALLSKANLDAKLNDYEESLDNFKKLIQITDGFSGNKIYNKIARVSAARLLLSMDKFDDALSMIDVYSSSDTNGYIHELTGDILQFSSYIPSSNLYHSFAIGEYLDSLLKSLTNVLDTK